MNIYAYTAPSSNYPPYISINRTDNGGVSITVRSPAKDDGACGDSAMITLTQDEFSELARKAYGAW
jgi:hypothetical protein